ncbi:MAG TPA: hypothetical protein PLM98_17980, partial [Thiolinea sp.]|nr:hypothetical protein [Thiolinea sp.]
MKAKALAVLVVAGVWGLGSWWMYTCKIKGFCGAPVTHSEQTSGDPTSTESKDHTPAITEAKTADTP